MKKQQSIFSNSVGTISVLLAVTGFVIGLISGIGVFLALLSLVLAGVSLRSDRMIFGQIVFPVVTIGLVFSVLGLQNDSWDLGTLLYITPFYVIFAVFFLLCRSSPV